MNAITTDLIARSEVTASIHMTQNESYTLRLAMAQSDLVREGERWIEIQRNPTTAAIYKEVVKWDDRFQSSVLEFTQENEAAISLALLQYRDAAKASGSRSDQVRASRVLKQVLVALDNAWAAANKAASEAAYKPARELVRLRDEVSEGFQPSEFVKVPKQDINRGLVRVVLQTIEQANGTSDDWSDYTYSTEIQSDFRVADGEVTMVFTHRPSGCWIDGAVVHSTFEAAFAEACEWLDEAGRQRNQMRQERFAEKVARIAELEADEDTVRRAQVVLHEAN